MDIEGWLRRLGLEQYEAAFRENAISEKVLPNLTAEDLKDLGVGMVGHRRMLLDAIAALRAEASAPTPLSDPPLGTDKAAKDTAERRQVTVMFSDFLSRGQNSPVPLGFWAEECVPACLDRKALQSFNCAGVPA
jgi:hypothetical protein